MGDAGMGWGGRGGLRLISDAVLHTLTIMTHGTERLLVYGLWEAFAFSFVTYRARDAPGSVLYVRRTGIPAGRHGCYYGHNWGLRKPF
jgi:hypothetical protein